ncbi:MAG TPA: hypothetical protein VLH79_05590 [Chthonomonadales bacterium]|nr:hypothetical protein [Chthonomonadales bacterium]
MALNVLMASVALLVQAPHAPPTAPVAGSTWSLAGREVLRMRATIGEWSPRKRVEEMEGRLVEVLSLTSAPLMPEHIALVVHKNGADVRIEVRGRLLVTVSNLDASANHTTAERLGRLWLAGLRATLPLIAPVPPPGAR